MKKIFVLIFVSLVVVCSANAQTQSNNVESPKVKYNLINEYGFYVGGSIGFTGIFVNGIALREADLFGIGIGYQTDTYDQSIPIFFNFRHYFLRNSRVIPLINVGVGTQIQFNEGGFCGPGLYATIAGGLKKGAFSFSGGLFLKTYSDVFCWSPMYTEPVASSAVCAGIEVKVGYTF